MPTTNQHSEPNNRLLTLLCLFFVLFTSYFTYFHNYWYPQAPYWDENYYITDAQREINGVFYMQIHPPLGKMLIAHGEKLFNANEDDASFIKTEHQGEFPPEFSFVGYRFFPVLLSWLAAPLLFFCFLFITRNPILSALLSFFYIFDNALIVHSRGAMLDGMLHFFIVLSILIFLAIFYTKARRRTFVALATALGASLACALTTKMSGAILILLPLMLAWHLHKEWRSMLKGLLAGCIGFAVVFVGIWQIHFARMSIIEPTLRDGGTYSASDTYKQILAEGRQTSLLSFPVMLRDSLRYMPEYNKGIPKLDLCKPDENGSPVFLWPIGATTINYRWATDGSGAYRYLYLVANPAVWFAVICGVLLSIVLLCGSAFYSPQHSQQLTEHKILTVLFLGLYSGYLLTFLRMDRVHFLYSYLPALIFGFFLVALVISSLQRIHHYALNEERKTMGVMILSLIIFACFQFFRPLSYYQPLTKEQMDRRSILRIWNLHCVGCEKPSPLVRRQCDQN